MSDDWEYSDDSCPKCSNQLAWRRCSDCAWDDNPDDDDDWPSRCDNCNDKGYEEWCRECGWDNVLKCFLSPQYEQAYLAKQTETKGEQA